MELIRLTDGADPRYARARALYNQSFPFHEQREERSQLNILGRRSINTFSSTTEICGWG